MSGSQHPFPSGYSGAQQPPMRNQFGNGPQMGLMPTAQPTAVAGIVNQQTYGVGMQPNPQPALAQQQQQNEQLQIQQQQQMQQQLQQQVQQLQQQQQPASQQSTPQPQPNPSQQQQQQSANKEFNTASLCRFGQETVQDIVSRALEVFSGLKTIQPPNGTSQGLNTSNEKKAKVQEQLRTIRLLFKRLRLIYEKCNENCQGMEYTHIEVFIKWKRAVKCKARLLHIEQQKTAGGPSNAKPLTDIESELLSLIREIIILELEEVSESIDLTSLIPLKEEWDMKSDEKKTSESYRVVCEENKEIMEQVVLKNRHLKEIIDHLRRIIWEINTMLTMRRS